MNRIYYRILALAFLACFFMATAASAAVTKVICVPWEGNELASHQTWDGKQILLKAVVIADNTAAMTWTVNFGDGSANQTGIFSGATKYRAQLFHTYTGAVGTPIIATLTVTDGVNTLSDTYRIKIMEHNLDTERAVAVDDGLWFLYWRQQANGSWPAYYYGCEDSTTASSVHAFEVNNHLPNGNPDADPYVDAVKSGLDFLFSRVRAVQIGAQTYGNPDANGNGIGIEAFGTYYHYPIYEGGIVMDAIINSRTPDASSGRDYDGDGQNDTYKDVVQDMCDMYSWGQSDYDDSYGGGWRYSWNEWPDNSACQ